MKCITLESTTATESSLVYTKSTCGSSNESSTLRLQHNSSVNVSTTAFQLQYGTFCIG